jgi:Lipoxygenase
MSVQYTPLTQADLDILALLEGFSVPEWTGPGLPRPEGTAGFNEILDTLNKLIARGQYLIQAKDGLSIPFTLNNITATAERFMLGTESQVQQAGNLRGLLTLIESFLSKISTDSVDASRIASAFSRLRTKVDAWQAFRAETSASHLTAAADGRSAMASTAGPSDQDDYSAFAMEEPGQFSMAWTTFEDAFRKGYPHLAEYCAAITDPEEATRQFWPMLRSTALPYNLLVLQKLTAVSVTTFQNNFETGWSVKYDELLKAGRLYGIDMTIFSDLDPQQLTNGTVRFTPSTMMLLEMDDRKNLNPIAVYAADPTNINHVQIYTPTSPAWIYGLLAAKTSLTVHGTWLGHVYTQHLVTASMQMATLNTLPISNIIYQLLAPHCNYTIAFDLILLLGWSSLSPPTSISDTGKFLTICNRFSATHDFFATDPLNTLASSNLDANDFTDPSIDEQQWNLYPNVQKILGIWQITADYVGAVVDVGYPTDAAVAADADLANWTNTASSESGGNVRGLPRMASKNVLKVVLTSILYRIVFHGIGRLRSVGSPVPTFAPNYPPCLQSTTLPDPQAPLPTSELLKTYLPNAGTLGQLISFYDIFAYSALYVPMIPYKGPDDELFFQNPTANQALIKFRTQVANIICTLQPDWLQIGQWPRNIEL